MSPLSKETLESIADWAELLTVVLALASAFCGIVLVVANKPLRKIGKAENEKLSGDVTAAQNELSKQQTRAAAAELRLAKFTASIHTVSVVGGVAIPDLSEGYNQRVALTADTRIAVPIFPHLPGNDSIMWTLFLDQDAKGSHVYSIDSAPDLVPVHGLLPNTRASFEFVTEANGTTSMRGLPVINRPITIAKAAK